MKRVRCPKCDNYITFDESQYEAGQSLVFYCPQCGKQFGIRIKAKTAAQAPPAASEDASSDRLQGDMSPSEDERGAGSIIVIENVFHYKQVLPLHMGDNTIGRYQKGNPITTPIETVDPSVDLLHCIINVSRDKHGRLRYILRDANSNTGTFVDNTEIPPRERRIIADGALFTIGATSIILREDSQQDNL